MRVDRAVLIITWVVYLDRNWKIDNKYDMKLVQLS